MHVHFLTTIGLMRMFELSNKLSENHQDKAQSLVDVSCSELSNKKVKSLCQTLPRGIQRKTLLVLLILIVVVVLQIPTVLYYTKLPSIELSILDSVNLETCSVSIRTCKYKLLIMCAVASFQLFAVQ